MKYESLILNQKDAVAVISINRQDKGNSISDLLMEEFIDIFSKPVSETGISIAIIRGVGEKFFCAGVDIGELSRKDVPAQREGFSKLIRFFESIRQSEIISIAAVNGLALGGGCGLAAVCDIAIAAEEAQFGLPEINAGLAPMIILLPLVRLVGSKTAFLLASKGHFISAEEAAKIGLISSVFKKGMLDDEANKLAYDLAGKSRTALSFIKQGMQWTSEFNYPRAYEYLKEFLTYTMLSDDSREGIRAFKEKR